MVVFSLLRSAKTIPFGSLLRPLNKPTTLQNVVARQMSGDKHFVVEPSRFQWHKFKDLVHYYVLVGAIPCLCVVFYANVFIGPATLTEIPEGYTPKHWEYHRHPISRWISQYVLTPPQQDYEKMCHAIHEEHDKAAMRLLEKEIKQKMAENQDYQAYYYKPVTAKYHRNQKAITDKQQEDLLGD